MRGGGAVRSRLPAVAGVVAIVALALGPGRSIAIAATAPTIAGHTNGQAGCNQLVYRVPGSTTNETNVVDPTPCDEWSIDVVPATPTSWQFDEERRIATSVPGGIAVEDKVHEGDLVDLTLDANGELASASITIDATGEITGGGYTAVAQALRIEFDSNSNLTLEGQMRTEGSGDSNASGSGSVKVEMSCPLPPGSTLPSTYSAETQAFAGAGEASPASNTAPIDAQVSSGGRCSLTLTILAGGSIAPWATGGSAGTGHARLELTITAAAAPCDLTGVVRTGDLAADGHSEPMPGVLIDLYKGAVDHGRAPDGSVLTDDAGRYCIRGLSPDAYEAEVQLTDRATLTLRESLGGPPILKVEAIAAAEFNSGFDKDISFTDPAGLVRDDDAYLYWQSWRFIDWLLQEGVILPLELGTVPMAFDLNAAETLYDPASGQINVAVSEANSFHRDSPDDQCPENCEWHEISHYVADQLEIADSCPSSRNHAGGENHSTCDSLSEGFAIWLPVVASLQLDALRGAGFATSDYAMLDNLEWNLSDPFTYEFDAATNQLYGLEEFAVAELLWDIMDIGNAEAGFTAVTKGPASALTPGSSTTPTITVHTPKDEIELGAPGFVRLMASAQVKTVTDVALLLYAAGQLPQPAKDVTVDLDGDGTADISRLDDVFLLHGFYPNRTEALVARPYLIGDPIPATDVYSPLDATVLDYARAGVPLLRGSAIELTNGGAEPATFTLDLSGPTAESHFEIVVGAGASEIVDLRLPTYWRSGLDPSKALPDCGAEGEQLVTISIAGAGLPERKIDSCEFRHLVAAATGPAALTFGNGTPGGTASGPPGASPGPGPAETPGGGPQVVILAVVALGVVVGAVVVLLVLRKRRPATK